MPLTMLDTIHERKRLANRIREEREKRGWTQDQLAIFANIDGRTTISKWERGIRSPRMISGKNLARAFGISVDELYGDER